MMRMVCDATMSAKTRMTTRALRGATSTSPCGGDRSSWGGERRGAADLDDLDLGALLEDDVVVVGARGPDLAADAHGPDAFVVGDAVQHDGAGAHEGGGAGPDLRRRVHVTLGDRPHEPEAGQRQHGEDDELPRPAGADEVGHHRAERADGEGGQEEAGG